MKSLMYILILFLVVSSCKKGNNKKIAIEDKGKISVKSDTIRKIKNYQSKLEFDSLLKKPKNDYLLLNPGKKKDTIGVLCNCEKDVKNNRILIQIRKTFPVQSELNDKYSGRHFIIYPNYPVQITYLTISIKDSILEYIKINRFSQEPQFENKYKVSDTIKKYKIRITKNKYNIAQNIWGEFEFISPLNFGIRSNDTIISGTFHCNNFEIEKFVENTSYPLKNKFKIDKNLKFQNEVKYRSQDEFDERYFYNKCEFNSTKDSLFISEDYGDGLSGSKLTITLTKKLNLSFIYETWTDCCSDYYLKYYFTKHEMVIDKNPFRDGTNNLVGTYWISTDIIPKLFGERVIKKGVFRCK